MADIKLIRFTPDCLSNEMVDILKGKQFIAIYVDENGEYRCSKNRINDGEACYMLNLGLARLFED